MLHYKSPAGGCCSLGGFGRDIAQESALLDMDTVRNASCSSKDDEAKIRAVAHALWELNFQDVGEVAGVVALLEFMSHEIARLAASGSVHVARK
eukprot:4952188-Amphidinium_carterae.1